MNCIRAFFAALFLFVASPAAYSAPGLLLVAHGSPAAEWNKPILELGDRVRDHAIDRGTFKAARTAFLEFAKPDIPTMIAELESEGCDRIVAVPLLIAPSGHSHFDVPAALGIYMSPATRDTLAAEGAAAAKPKVPITMTQTLSEGDFLGKYAFDQVKKLTTEARDEALVLISHGDADHQGLNERLMRRVATYCCGKSGIAYADWAYVEVGQGYVAQALPAFERALRDKKRVIVVGLYVATSAKALHERTMKNVHGHGAQTPDAINLALSTESIIDNPNTARWVVDAASACIAP